MRFCYPEINKLFDTEGEYINTLVVENSLLFYRLLSDLQNQLSGGEGISVLSEDNKILAINKYMECLSQFIPFEINQKSLLNKAISSLEKRITGEEHYEKAMELLSMLEAFLYEAAVELTGDISFSKINMGNIIKAAGMEFCNDYETLGEKILSYMELVGEYDNVKLFLFVNLRSYMTDEETKLFMETVLQHRFHVIMLENHEYDLLHCEKRYVIDKDLCEISR